ncbi:unnamed protein product [Didymodactylos carnosus]|uniref:Pentatricopeptide repeat-containing protein n=1 Tax=Didymodactylos carnosus TaxID=1234261 RepID=A0A8S2EHP2_9BILA|nr:unnamed protein product [Didymodactylos carnosus]CAF3987950.1 unnamed protein product [Didymodactylos carnosus]
MSTFVDFTNQIKQLNDHKQYQKAIALFETHIQYQLPTNPAINQALKACIELADLKRGSDIHQSLSPQSKKNPFIQTNLIRLYMKCGDLSKAQEILRESRNMTPAMYNALLNGLANNNRGEQALDLFRQMTVPPDEYTYSILFKICTQLGDQDSIQFGKNLLEKIPVRYQTDTILLNSALHMLMQNGEISMGEKLFSRMNKYITTYGVMMSGYIKNNRPQEAIDLFFKMDKPDEVNLIVFFSACAQLGNEKALNLGKQVFSRLSTEFHENNVNEKVLHGVLNMFIKCSDIENAEKLFARLNGNVITYGSMMTIYNSRNEPDKTLALFEQMKRKKIEVNDIIWVLVINALSELSDLSVCESVISEMAETFLINIQIQNALIDMWGKASSVDKAKNVFETISKPDAISFSAMSKYYFFKYQIVNNHG